MARLLCNRSALAAAVMVVSAAVTSPVRAEEASAAEAGDANGDAARQQCFAAHGEAQELRKRGQLLEAQAQLQLCSRAECPGVIIEDCGRWMGDVEAETPSMVFEVTVDGKDAPDATITVDGALVEDKVRGFQVNPGSHTVRATLPPHEAITRTVTLPAGQRMRLVSFEFQSAPGAAAEQAPFMTEQVTRPTPTMVYPLLGLGIAGLATYGVLAGLGKTEQGRLEETCAPSCTDDDMSSMKRMYLIGDISAGVGAAALLTAGIIYLVRPTVRESVPQVSVAVDPRGDSFGIMATGSF